MKSGTWDHTKNGLWVKCITTIRATSGIQWGKSQIRVLEGEVRRSYTSLRLN
jgi:hypothetical protein